MPRIHTVYCEVCTMHEAVSLASRLIHESAWFECTPCPDDMWGFEVKADCQRLLPTTVAHHATYRNSL